MSDITAGIRAVQQGTNTSIQEKGKVALAALRDEFAKAAMQGFLADPNVTVKTDEGARIIAFSAYAIADAMLAERAK